MALIHESTTSFCPFEWPAFRCPVCRGRKFISLDHAAVYCERCCARFVVRMTAGDPGCVVDCFTTKEQGAHVYGPMWECQHPGCDKQGGSWKGPLKCKQHGPMKRRNRCQMQVLRDQLADRYCLILKLGDYCSQWMITDSACLKLAFPTQKEWNAWQEVLEREREIRKGAVA